MGSIMPDNETVGRFAFEGDPRAEIADQVVGAYRCECGHNECRSIGVACLSIHVGGEMTMQDTICMSPGAWRATIKRVTAILDKEFPYDV
jgi:hypothetical protein